MDYRLELFNNLNEIFEIDFVFTKQGRGQNNVKENHLDIPETYNHKVLKTDLLIKKIDIGMYLNLLKEIVFGKYDLLLISNSWYICWPIAKLTRKKTVIWTEFWHYNNTSLFRTFLNKYMQIILLNSDMIIATGSKVSDTIMKLGIPEKKIINYPQCSVDYKSMKCPGLDKYYLFENKKIILYCGRIIKRKGLDVLIKAVNVLNLEFTNIHLVIIGTGPFEIECQKLARQLNIDNISFLGYVDECSKIDLFKRCDIFVAPSIMYYGSYEPWGLVVNEVMAFGKPIVATTAVGSAFDLIKNDYNGFIVNENEIEPLVSALRKIIGNEETMKQMGWNSLEIFKDKNDYRKMTNAFENAIKKAIL